MIQADILLSVTEYSVRTVRKYIYKLVSKMEVT